MLNWFIPPAVICVHNHRPGQPELLEISAQCPWWDMGTMRRIDEALEEAKGNLDAWWRHTSPIRGDEPFSLPWSPLVRTRPFHVGEGVLDAHLNLEPDPYDAFVMDEGNETGTYTASIFARCIIPPVDCLGRVVNVVFVE
jgi:hypothetical protein